MNCQQAREATSLYADGLLPEFERRLLERHLRECEDCQAFAVSALASAALPTIGPLSGAPDPGDAETQAHAASRRTSREPPGQAQLGTLLARAVGYQVLDAERRRVGVVDHLRYRSRLDLPDAIAVASGRFAWRRLRLVPLSAVEAIDPENRTVLLRLAPAQVQRLAQLGRCRASACRPTRLHPFQRRQVGEPR